MLIGWLKEKTIMAADLILVPVDLEPASMKALDMAEDLAQRLDATVIALHVYTLPRFAYPGFTPVLPPTLTEDIAAAARRAIDSVGTQRNIRVVLREGDAATEILDVIEELSPRLVVMGTHGRRGLSRLVLGSVAEKVIRKSTVPVMTIRSPKQEEQPSVEPRRATGHAAI
jgi:nucleotide-binding universal stress UspA family protein